MVADRAGHLGRIPSFLARVTNYALHIEASLFLELDRPRDY